MPAELHEESPFATLLAEQEDERARAGRREAGLRAAGWGRPRNPGATTAIYRAALPKTCQRRVNGAGGEGRWWFRSPWERIPFAALEAYVYSIYTPAHTPRPGFTAPSFTGALRIALSAGPETQRRMLALHAARELEGAP